MPIVELFRALGDSTRLKMVKRLSSEGSHTITSLSKELRMSRQGARKHLKILVDSKLIKLKSEGRTTSVELDRRSLDEGRKFIADLEVQWEKRLGRLETFLKK